MNKIILLIVLSFIFYGCALQRIDVSCLDIESSKESKEIILNQIDSVFNLNSLQCDKRSKIIGCSCSDINLLKVKALEIKVSTKCNDYRYFYFDENLKLLYVVKELNL